MRRLIGGVAALLFAIALNVVLLAAALVLDPVARSTAIDLLGTLFDAAVGDMGLDLVAVSHAFSTAAFMICVLPQTLSALIAFAARTRSVLFAALAPGILAAAAPLLLRLAANHTPGRPTQIENRFLAIFFICAALAGTVYGLLTRERPVRPRR